MKREARVFGGLEVSDLEDARSPASVITHSLTYGIS